MLSSELYYKVNSIDEEAISINDYQYLRVNVTIPGHVTMIVYVGVKHAKNIKVDSYYYCKRAYLTSSYEEKVMEGEFSFRVDSVVPSSKEDFTAQNERTVVTFNARVGKRPKNEIKLLGPMKIPTYSVRALIKNEIGKQFHILVVGYHAKARQLDGLAPVTYIDVIGNISPPKKPGKSCAIILKEYKLRKEVQV